MQIEKPNKKKEVLKLLKIIGIDTRFISYSENAIFINDQRFSKFSKKRQEIFKKYYPEMDIISSGSFQKICIRASKVLSEEVSPKDKILLLKSENDVDELLKIVLEPYSRKYGVSIIESNIRSLDVDYIANNDIELNIDEDINLIAISLTLDEKVEDILSNIFSGNGIGDISTKKNKRFKFIYPFINISNNLIDSFNKKIQEDFINSRNNNDSKFKNNCVNNNNKNNKTENYENKNESSIIAESFMEFLEDIIPQYKENLLKSTIFIENELNNKN